MFETKNQVRREQFGHVLFVEVLEQLSEAEKRELIVQIPSIVLSFNNQGDLGGHVVNKYTTFDQIGIFGFHVQSLDKAQQVSAELAKKYPDKLTVQITVINPAQPEYPECLQNFIGGQNKRSDEA